MLGHALPTSKTHLWPFLLNYSILFSLVLCFQYRGLLSGKNVFRQWLEWPGTGPTSKEMRSFSGAVFKVILCEESSPKSPPLLQKCDPSLVQGNMVSPWKLNWVKLNNLKVQLLLITSFRPQLLRNYNNNKRSAEELKSNKGLAAGGGPDIHLSAVVCQPDEEEGGLLTRKLE